MLRYSTSLTLVTLWQKLLSQPLKIQSLYLSALGCGAFFIYSIIYCQFYVSYIVDQQPSLLGSMAWSLRTYGIWFLLTPLLLMAYSKLWQHHKKHLIHLFIGSIIAAISFRIGAMAFISADANLIKSVIRFAPTHITAATLVLIAWAVLLKPQQRQDKAHADKKAIEDNLKADLSHEIKPVLAKKNLRVQTGTQEIDLKVSDIESISAAGNYMEVFDGQQTYIIRSTMKALALELKPYQFIQVHRSHLINLSSVRQICNKDNNQNIILKSGKQFPVTVKYQRYIKALMTEV